MQELEEKNKLLVRLCKRQEAELRKFHEAKSELPHLLQAHKMEILVLQDRLRKLTEAHRRDTSKLRQQEERLLKSTEETTRLKELMKKRNLPEREELSRKLSDSQSSLAEKQQVVHNLERRLALVEKSSRQQVAAEEGRHRTTNRRLQALRRDHRALQKTLQERDKELAAVQHYRSRAISALTSKGARGSTSNLSTSSTTGFSSMHMSSASSRSTSLSAHPGGRTQRVQPQDTSDADQDSAEPVVQSDVEGQRITTRRTKSGRMLPPISSQQRGSNAADVRSEAQCRRHGLHQEESSTSQVNRGWQSHWWSQSQEEDSQTYMILSSPEPLSSTSPLSANEHQSPTAVSKSAAATGALQLSLDHAVNSMYGRNSQTSYSHLNRCNMPRNTFDRGQTTIQKVLRKTTYSRPVSDLRCVCSMQSNKYLQSEENEFGCNCEELNNNSCHSMRSSSNHTSHQERLEEMCPLDLATFQAEKRSSRNDTPQSAMTVALCSTLSSTPEEDHSKPEIESLEEHKCSCALMTDDSSVNPSPELRGSTTTDCEAELPVAIERSVLVDNDTSDADRKDSNTSNVTDVSCVTTTSNVSKISNASENSVPSTDDLPAAYVRRKSSADQFSLIENYPPKERRKLQKEIGSISAGSDTSGSGPSPPPVRGVPNSATRYRPPPSAKLSRQNSVGLGDIMRHKHTVSLTHLDSRNQSGANDARAAITP
ncbi:Lebercilin domain [Trinorchestia longiramus]|nr:Lebercilin domain [Trinorchestia longiramus]